MECWYKESCLVDCVENLWTVFYTCMQGLTNPLPGRPGQVLNPAGQVCSVFTTPGRASVKKSPGQLKVRVFTVKKSDQKMSINIDN